MRRRTASRHLRGGLRNRLEFGLGQSSRLVEIAPASPVVALSLNSSMLFFGQAAGAGLASLAVTRVAPVELGFIGAACAIAALVVLRWSTGTRRTPAQRAVGVKAQTATLRCHGGSARRRFPL